METPVDSVLSRLFTNIGFDKSAHSIDSAIEANNRSLIPFENWYITFSEIHLNDLFIQLALLREQFLNF